MHERAGLGLLLHVLFVTAQQVEDVGFEVRVPARTTTETWPHNGAGQFRGFATPQPPGILPSDPNMMFASVWATWSAWSFCVNGMRMRVRACNTVRGFSCLGANKEVQPCDAFDPGIMTQRRRIETSDYDSVDPWESDRREAMKQLYTDPDVDEDANEDDPMPPQPRNDDNFATLNNNGLGKRHRAAGVKTIAQPRVNGVPLLGDPQRFLERQRLLEEAEKAKIGIHGLRRPNVNEIINPHPPGVQQKGDIKKEAAKALVNRKPPVERIEEPHQTKETIVSTTTPTTTTTTTTPIVTQIITTTVLPMTERVHLRNSGHSFFNASPRRQHVASNDDSSHSTEHYPPPVVVVPKRRLEQSIQIPSPVPVQPFIRPAILTTEFPSLIGSEELEDSEGIEESDEKGDKGNENEIPELPDGLEEEFPTGFTPQDVQNFFDDDTPHFDPLPTKSPLSTEETTKRPNQGQDWQKQIGDSNRKEVKEMKESIEKMPKTLTKEELLESSPTELELIETLEAERKSVEAQNSEKAEIEVEDEKTQAEIPLASIFSEKAIQQESTEEPDIVNPFPKQQLLTTMIRGDIEVLPEHESHQSSIEIDQPAIEPKEETQPLNSNNPTFANNKIDRKSLQEAQEKEDIEQISMGLVDETPVKPRNAPEQSTIGEEMDFLQPFPSQNRAQGWKRTINKPFLYLKESARPTLQDVFPQQRQDESGFQGQLIHPMPPKPRLENHGEISDDTARALDWMLANITRVAEDGDRKFFSQRSAQQDPSGYSNTLPHKQLPQLPAGTRVVHGISKKKPAGAASYTQRKNAGWTHKTHSGGVTTRPSMRQMKGISHRKAWKGLSKPKYPKVDGGAESNNNEYGDRVVREQVQKATFARQKPKGFYGYDGFNFQRQKAHAAPTVQQNDKDGLVGEIAALEELMKNIETELKTVDEKKHKAAEAIQEFRRDEIEAVPIENDGLHSDISLVKMSKPPTTTTTSAAMDLELAPKVGFEVQRKAPVGVVPQTQNEPVFFTDSIMSIGGSTAHWGPWSNWGNCFCGNQVRTRACDYVVGFTTTGCEGPSYEARPCVGGVCPDKTRATQIKFKVSKVKLHEPTEAPSRGKFVTLARFLQYPLKL
ncbi:unnamed protein product, partial [Mesorhabditis belari]|uniref:Uncharacterized protein n=1 Tax=Mesorhabditis belari TaxID=2138241 RepID=A0AAF3FAN6_9BILA